MYLDLLVESLLEFFDFSIITLATEWGNAKTYLHKDTSSHNVRSLDGNLLAGHEDSWQVLLVSFYWAYWKYCVK